MNNPVLTNNTLRVKESNTNLILDALRNAEVATRTEIAKTTGLSIATCGNILKDLVASGEILEGDLENNNGGRPARQYIYNKDFSLIVAIVLHSDGTVKALRYAVTNLYGEVLEERVKLCDRIDADTINTLVGSLIETHPNIRSVGIGIPGYAEKDGTIGIADIEELNGTNPVKLLESNFNINVAIDRSPSVSAYGFYKTHPEYSKETLATVLIPSGHPAGSGFIINGQIYKGSFNREGEISYIYEGFLKELQTGDENVSQMMQVALFSIAAIISTINPSIIVLMGKSFTEENYRMICEKCSEIFPPNFLPKFELQQDYSDSYLQGMIEIAIDQLMPKIKLIAK